MSSIGQQICWFLEFSSFFNRYFHLQIYAHHPKVRLCLNHSFFWIPESPHLSLGTGGLKWSTGFPWMMIVKESSWKMKEFYCRRLGSGCLKQLVSFYNLEKMWLQAFTIMLFYFLNLKHWPLLPLLLFYLIFFNYNDLIYPSLLNQHMIFKIEGIFISKNLNLLKKMNILKCFIAHWFLISFFFNLQNNFI